MRLCLFSFFFLLGNLFAFEVNDCLKNSFESEVIHKTFPFGLLQKEISFNKIGCQIDLKFKRYKYLEDFWRIDVCRSPVHIKKGASTVEVIRKEASCAHSNSDFCKEWKSLKRYIQDNGLIFAEGSKENLLEDHGKFYCVYQLLESYLEKETIFSLSQDYIDFGAHELKAEVHESSTSLAPVPVVEGMEPSREDETSHASEPTSQPEEKSGSF